MRAGSCRDRVMALVVIPTELMLGLADILVMILAISFRSNGSPPVRRTCSWSGKDTDKVERNI